MDNIKKPVDYYDRIADALEIISGNDSHINDESPIMDYYDRIADALESIAEDGIADGSITEDKFSDTLKLKTIKDYVTPEMYGAVGDGETDDSEAVQNAIDNNDKILFLNKYAVDGITIETKKTIIGINNELSGLVQLPNNNKPVIDLTQDAIGVHISNINIRGNRENGGYNHGIRIIGSAIAGASTHKYHVIRDVLIGNIGQSGIYANSGYNIFVNLDNVYILGCDGDGAVLNFTDSVCSGITIGMAKKHGLVLLGGNNKYNNVKVYLCGANTNNPEDGSGIHIRCKRTSLCNIESQENRGHGFYLTVDSNRNIITNAVSDANGINPSTLETYQDSYAFYVYGSYYNTVKGLATDFHSQQTYIDIINDVSALASNFDITGSYEASVTHNLLYSTVYNNGAALVDGVYQDRGILDADATVASLKPGRYGTAATANEVIGIPTYSSFFVNVKGSLVSSYYIDNKTMKLFAYKDNNTGFVQMN